MPSICCSRACHRHPCQPLSSTVVVAERFSQVLARFVEKHFRSRYHQRQSPVAQAQIDGSEATLRRDAAVERIVRQIRLSDCRNTPPTSMRYRWFPSPAAAAQNSSSIQPAAPAQNRTALVQRGRRGVFLKREAIRQRRKGPARGHLAVTTWGSRHLRPSVLTTPRRIATPLGREQFTQLDGHSQVLNMGDAGRQHGRGRSPWLNRRRGRNSISALAGRCRARAGAQAQSAKPKPDELLLPVVRGPPRRTTGGVERAGARPFWGSWNKPGED